MLSQRAKYGLKALLYMADHAGEKGVRGMDISAAETIPKKFLDIILLELKAEDLITSKKGKQGGYQLARSPERISVGQVIRILDGPLAPVSCVSRTAYKRCADCRDENACRIRRIMGQVRDAIADILDNTSLADMRKGPAEDIFLYYDI